MNNREKPREKPKTETTWWHWKWICIFASDGDVLSWQRLNLGKPAFCCFILVDLDRNPVPAITIPMAPTTDFWLTDPTRMVVMGAALHALGTGWSAKLDDMYKRANKSLVMKCRHVEKVKLTGLWVTINVNSFNLVESLLLAEGEAGSRSLCLLGPYTRTDSMPSEPRIPSHAHSTEANRRPRPFFQ